MKKIPILIVAFLLSLSLFGQNAQYVEAMENAKSQMEAAQTAEEWQSVGQAFERIGHVEKEAWLPSYYQSLCYVKLALHALQTGEGNLEQFVDRAQEALDPVLEMAPDDSEVHALQGYVYTSRIWADPMVGGAIYSSRAHRSFERAIELNKDNPRAYYLRGQLVFHTPDFFGGGPDRAHGDLAKADALFQRFRPENSIAPNWGQGTNTHFLKMSEAAREK